MVPTCDVSGFQGDALLADGESSSGQSSEAHLQEIFKPPVSYSGCLQQREVALLCPAASRHLSDVGLAACSQVVSENGKEKEEDACRSQNAQRGLPCGCSAEAEAELPRMGVAPWG